MEADWARVVADGAQLGDRRRNRSLEQVLEALFCGRGKSWSAALGSRLRQAGGDLVNLSGLRVEQLLAGEFARTAERCRQEDWVIVSQDTTAFAFGGRARRGLGRLGDRPGAEGLWGHAALVVAPDGRPLGLLAVTLWARRGNLTAKETRPYEERESYKWLKTLKAVCRRLPAGQQALVVADREADIFEYLMAPRPAGVELLVRCGQVRLAGDEGQPEEELQSVLETVWEAPVLRRVTAQVGRQEVALTVRARWVEVKSPKRWPAAKRCRLPLTVIGIREEVPRAGAEPLEWVLLTTQRADDAKTAVAMAEAYRRRWRIEGQHEVMKQEGLRAERLQMRHAAALKRALALYYVVGVRAMELCYEARENPLLPANERFTEDELAVLAVVRGQPTDTLGEAVAEVAKLGGWEGFPSSSPYGPKTVQRGLEALAFMLLYHRAAQRYDP